MANALHIKSDMWWVSYTWVSLFKTSQTKILSQYVDLPHGQPCKLLPQELLKLFII